MPAGTPTQGQGYTIWGVQGCNCCTFCYPCSLSAAYSGSTPPSRHISASLTPGGVSASHAMSYAGSFLVGFGPECTWSSGGSFLIGTYGGWSYSISITLTCRPGCTYLQASITSASTANMLWEYPGTCFGGGANLTLTAGWNCSPLSINWTGNYVDVNSNLQTLSITLTP